MNKNKNLFCICLLSLFFVSRNAFSQETHQKDIDDDVLFSHLQELQKKEFINEENKIQSEELNQKEEKETKSDRHIGMIKKGSKIFSLNNEDQVFEIPKKTFIYYKIPNQNNHDLYILNKKEEILYRTARENVISMDETVSLNPTPSSYHEYPPAKDYASSDLVLKLKTSFQLHSQQMTVEDKTANAVKGEFKVFYTWKIPLEFGLSSSYQAGKENLNDEQNQDEQVPARFSSYYFWPIARYQFFQNENYQLYFGISSQKSFAFTRIDQETENTYSKDVFETNFEIMFPSKLGSFIAGFHYQLIRSSLKKTNLPDQSLPKNEKQNDQCVSLSLGYGRDLLW